MGSSTTKGLATSGRAWAACVTLITVCLLSGCTGAGSLPSSPLGSGAASETSIEEEKTFTGTAQEHVDAKMACVQRHGLAVEPGDPNDGPSFAVSSEGVGQDRVDEVLAACDAEVGVYVPPPATRESVTARFEWKLGQYKCLVAAGFPAAEPPSLQVVLDEWESTGHSSYDPMSALRDQYGAALAACPRSTEKWPD